MSLDVIGSEVRHSLTNLVRTASELQASIAALLLSILNVLINKPKRTLNWCKFELHRTCALNYIMLKLCCHPIVSEFTLSEITLLV